MADSKKYNGSTWQHSLRKLGTSTDTLTTLPADVYADGQSATVGLVGNMEQSLTPTPTTPIQPSECGERTGNLLNRATSTVGKIIANNGTITDNENYSVSDYIPVTAGDYSFSLINNYTGAANTNNRVLWFDSTKENRELIFDNAGVRPENVVGTFTVANSGYLRFSYRNTDTNIMLNTGSTALPYEPYGYKIPISSASTTTPVYLGEVQTTRKIVKRTFNGSESFSSGSVIGQIRFSTGLTLIDDAAICSHYILKETYSSTGKPYIRLKSNTVWFELDDTGYETKEACLADFITYLQQQYAAGTPVCVWYVLATPTTGIVNEPIRKIGDYADTVSGITIPTITGKDTVDVETTLKPSEVSLAYTGWHDASAKEWDGSEWQDEQPVFLLSASNRPTLTESTPDIMDIIEPEEEKE